MTYLFGPQAALPDRDTAAFVTASLAAGASETGSTAIFGEGAVLLNIETDGDAWVRFYSTNAALLADALRLIDEPVAAGEGILADLVFDTANAHYIDCAPKIELTNGDDPEVALVYYRITNTAGSAHAVTVTCTFRPAEG